MRALALEEQRKATILEQAADLMEKGYQSDKAALDAKDAQIADLQTQLADAAVAVPVK